MYVQCTTCIDSSQICVENNDANKGIIQLYLRQLIFFIDCEYSANDPEKNTDISVIWQTPRNRHKGNQVKK